MSIRGHIHNGVVVLDGESTLPEGTAVDIVVRSSPVIHVAKHRCLVVLPLVRSDAPGSVDLTADRIAEILADQEIEALKSQWNDPS